LVVLVAAACSSNGAAQPDEAGPCKIIPGVVCRNQDLRGVSLVAADLEGADFSGSDLRGSDLRDANLTNAKLVGASLGDVNFTGASLKGADLSKANLLGTIFTQANLSGANRTGTFVCNVVEPDGAITAGVCASADTNPDVQPFGPTPTAPTAPPKVEYFRAAAPERCLNDAAGTGIDIEWSIRNSTGMTFSVDGIRIAESAKPRSSTRIPFVCDRKPHTVTVQAYGAVLPQATASFTASLAATAPDAPAGS
jgi:Pentapeptide repeats (8 copies)